MPNTLATLAAWSLTGPRGMTVRVNQTWLDEDGDPLSLTDGVSAWIDDVEPRDLDDFTDSTEVVGSIASNVATLDIPVPNSAQNQWIRVTLDGVPKSIGKLRATRQGEAIGDDVTFRPATGEAVTIQVVGQVIIEDGGGGSSAPDDATYLVTTASGDLSAEVVVGATPGGELGGTWASPTVDTTHSGSSHATVQAAAEATAAAALSAHAGAADPHPGYLTPAEGNAAYDAIGAATAAQAAAIATAAADATTKANTAKSGAEATAAAALTAHEAAANPHPVYLTQAEADGVYLSVPTGTKAAGKVPLATGSGDTAHAWTALAKGDVGLGNVDNTADTAKPVSTAQQTALDLKADLASPPLTGNPTAPTQTAGNNSTRIATTAFVTTAVAAEATARDTAISTAVDALDSNAEVVLASQIFG